MTNIRRLEYFLAVAEELNFCRTATRLDMAQPPLSRQIAQLEEEVGVKLLDRTRSQIKLTQAGSVFECHVRQILKHWESALIEARQTGAGAAGHLKIALAGSAFAGPLPPLLKRYRQDYPDVALDLSTMDNPAQRRALIRREIDIAVTRSLFKDPEFRSLTLNKEPLILAIPEESSLLELESITLADLADQTVIVYPRDQRAGHADTVRDLFFREQLPLQHAESARDFESAMHLVAVGVGIAIVPESVSTSLRQGIQFRSYKGYNPGTSLKLYHRIDNRSPQLIQFVDSVRKPG